MLDKSEFARVLRQRPQFRKSIVDIAQARYNVSPEEMLKEEV